MTGGINWLRDTRRSGRRRTTGESRLERENRLLKQALAEKTLDVDFFKSALQKVAARRQGRSKPGETASTTKSGS
jgi:hypothetical protein